MKKGNVDKGFEINYYNLSYRRKFIRTLWMIPFMILTICLMVWMGAPLFITIPVAVIFAVTGFIQAFHNYKKWQEETDKK